MKSRAIFLTVFLALLATSCADSGDPLPTSGLDTTPDIRVSGDARADVPDVKPDTPCVPSCGGKECGDDGCGGTCGACAEGQVCSGTGLCEVVDCAGKSYTIEGIFSNSAEDFEFDAAEIALLHKIDVDLDEDGCITSVEVRLRRGTGCTLHLVAGSSYGPNGGLLVQDFTLFVDSQCPGFSDALEGLYEDSGDLELAEIVLDDTELSVDNVEQWCFPSSLTVHLSGTVYSLDAGAQIDILPTTITVSGSFLSTGDDTLACPCVPDCADKDCGGDGCGGSCGSCTDGYYCNSGTCEEGECIPDCDGKECGDDGCGGNCGTCANGYTCDLGTCLEVECTPDCGGKECGDDGCGETCGTCECGETCDSGACVFHACDGKECGTDGCGDSCGACLDGYFCDQGVCEEGECVPDCAGKECGEDGCGATCGGCGCGEACEAGVCIFTACDDKECGSDGCGGSCGVCDCGETCDIGTCIFHACDGKVCGSDGCGGECGTCVNGFACSNGECVPAGCQAEALVVDGDFNNDVSPITFDSVTAQIIHKRDVDEWEDGCITYMQFTFTKGTGCTLSVTTTDTYDLDGHLIVQDVSFTADSQCPGFPDQAEGTYVDYLGLLDASVELGVNEVAGYDVQETCFNSWMIVHLDGHLKKTGGPSAPELAVQSTSIEVSGDFISTGDYGASCPCQPSCAQKECGSDGCGGGCGTCTSFPNSYCNEVFQCSCSPECAAKNCGSDGCGGSCGTCGCGESCDGGICEFHACDGKECGIDGCGGSCGSCQNGQECNGALCEWPPSTPLLLFKHDQFADTIDEAVSDIQFMALLTQPGFQESEGVGQKYLVLPEQSPVKFTGVDVVFAMPPNCSNCALEGQLEFWYLAEGQAYPSGGSPDFALPFIGEPVGADIGLVSVVFDWLSPDGHPPVFFGSDFSVVVRFTHPSQDFQAEWGTFQCSQQAMLGMCGCQEFGSLHDQATTIGGNLLHIAYPPGNCDAIANKWVLIEDVGITGDIIMRVHGVVSDSGS